MVHIEGFSSNPYDSPVVPPDFYERKDALGEALGGASASLVDPLSSNTSVPQRHAFGADNLQGRCARSIRDAS